MSELTSTIFGWIDLIQIPLTLAAIVILFLKRRIWVGAFGIFMGVTGIALHFPLFRDARDVLGDWWWWTWRGQGLAILGLLIWVALAPAAPVSWWQRSGAGRDTHEG